MSEPASQQRSAFSSAALRPSLLAGLVGLLFSSLVLAVAARAENSAARPPASVAPKEAVPAPAKDTAPADPADLGRGLRYLQLAAGTSDSAFAASLAAPALVLDLRLAPAVPAVEARLRELLARATAARPLFVLVGTGTALNLRDAIPANTPGVLVLTAKGSGIATAMTIAVDTVTDRAAAEALAAGRPPRELFEEQLDKPRYDEERLAKDHANGQHESHVSEPRGKKDSSDKPSEPAAPALHDLILQRAVFIHRGLLALGRIPEHT